MCLYFLLRVLNEQEITSLFVAQFLETLGPNEIPSDDAIIGSTELLSAFSLLCKERGDNNPCKICYLRNSLAFTK